MKPRKWNREIKAWADGKTIQRRIIGTETWKDANPSLPQFGSLCLEFRIKPEAPKYAAKAGDLVLVRDYPKDEYEVDIFIYELFEDYPFICERTVWKEIKLHPLQQERDRYKKELEEKQAIIDRLRLEYCSDEMTKGQLDAWKDSQVKSGS